MPYGVLFIYLRSQFMLCSKNRMAQIAGILVRNTRRARIHEAGIYNKYPLDLGGG